MKEEYTVLQDFRMDFVSVCIASSMPSNDIISHGNFK